MKKGLRYYSIPDNFTGTVTKPSGRQEWYRNGVLHREDGPALIDPRYYTVWYLNGQYHREGGPAIEWTDGHKEWFLNGKQHREDGPAYEDAEGNKSWYMNGKCLYTTLAGASLPFLLLEEFEDGKHIKVLTEFGIQIWKNIPGLKELAENWEEEYVGDWEE
jgi:hypothetical protein